MITKRLSTILPDISNQDAVEELRSAADKYVCKDCGKADNDPFISLLDDSDKLIMFLCPSCSPTAKMAHLEELLETGSLEDCVNFLLEE